jgi:hypothetical protein
MEGNTSINPFFYGTYLGETKPNEPVTRTKKQAFQADAVGAAHQLTEAHFLKMHTFRLEWQPGPGGRLDWFVKAHRLSPTLEIEGDGHGNDWVHAYGLEDKVLSDLMGSQIPNEPSYLIMNTAISSTWGFPYDTPEWCTKCYDCDDPNCACNFAPGFCEMVRYGKTNLLIDHVRVYQSSNADAHVGANHTLGCDPPDYPTKEWIEGHSYRYMRNPPFSYDDKGKPLRPIQNGGGTCKIDRDCGAHAQNENLTAVWEEMQLGEGQTMRPSDSANGRGRCVHSSSATVFRIFGNNGNVCQCNDGFTGPHCLTLDMYEESPSAQFLIDAQSPFRKIVNIEMPMFMLTALGCMIGTLILFIVGKVVDDKRYKNSPIKPPPTRNSGYAPLITSNTDV